MTKDNPWEKLLKLHDEGSDSEGKRLKNTWHIGPNTITVSTETFEQVKSIWPVEINKEQLKRDGSHLMSKDKFLYFECETCQKLFDPETQSFKTLHDKAHEQGWKVVWNLSGLGYKIYCSSCEKNDEKS